MAGRPDFSITMGLVGASTVLTGIKSTIDIITSLVRKVAELAEAADAYGDVVAGHRVSVQQADEATSHLIDSIELHRQAARLEAAGLQLTAQQFRALTVAATQYAQTTGGDVTEAVQGLTQAVISGSSRGLRPYGIQLQATGTMAQRQRTVIDQLTRSFGDQRVEINGTQDAIEQLQNLWSTAWHEMLLTLEREAGPIQTIIRGISSVLDDIVNALQTLRNSREHMERMGTTAEQLRIQNELEAAGYDLEGNPAAGLANAVERTVSLQGRSALGIITGTEGAAERDAWARQQAARLAQLQEQDIADIAAGAPVVSDAPTPAYSTPDGGGGGGGGGPTDEERAAELLQRQIAAKERAVYEALRESEDRIAELYEENRNNLREFWREFSEEQVQGAVEAAWARVDAEREAMEHLAELQEDYQERVLEQVERETEARQRSLERLKTYAGVAYQIYGQMVGAVGDLAGSLAENAEEQKKIEGGIRVAQQVGALLYATTMAAVEFAGQNYAQGALYTAAAVVAGLNLAKTIQEYGVQSKSGTTGSSGSAARGSAGDASAGAMYQGRQPTITVYFTGPVTSRRARDEVVALERDGARGY